MSKKSGLLTYTAKNGTIKEKHIEKIDSVSITDDSLARIDLKSVASFGATKRVNIASSSLHLLDLSPLSSCPMLETLYLRTDLQEIDLSPLESCKKLRNLTLISNKEIRRIDLTSLRNCRNLESLNLSNNSIEEIDLSPLGGNNKFSFLNLVINRLENIDLSPLGSCSNLVAANLGSNYFDDIDLGPLSSCKKLELLSFGTNLMIHIDLSPLKTCTKLKNLRIAGRSQSFASKDPGLSDIDLSPLGSCTALEQLGLVAHHLQEIDLEALSNCPNLWKLELYRNELRSIDLSPLYEHSKLGHLRLETNLLERIDLTPLGSCTNLYELQLGNNRIQDIDLGPLCSCEKLVILGVRQTLDEPSYDLTPLVLFATKDKLKLHLGPDAKTTAWIESDIPALESATYRRPDQTTSWRFLRRIAEEYGADSRVQHDILYALNLNEYGFIDSDLRELLLSFPEETPIGEVKNGIVESLVNKIVEQVDRKGPTVGLKLDALATKHREIAARSKDILELREREMKRVQIPITVHKRGNLRKLWITAYGYDVLSALNPGLDVNREILDGIIAMLASLGYELKTTGSSGTVSPVKMTKELKKCIWWLAKATFTGKFR